MSLNREQPMRPFLGALADAFEALKAAFEAYVVPAGSIGTNELADGAVTGPKIADGAVDMDKLADAVRRGYVRSFETVAAMQAATDLQAGMVCHTNGFHTSGDGGAAYYTVGTSGDIALQSGLYATKASDTKIMVAIGDSFGHEADQGANLWPVLVSSRLGLTLHNYCQGGAGYARPSDYVGAKTFGMELTEAVNDTSFDNASVSLVVIYGGYNDVASAQDVTTFSNNAETLYANALTSFPNAQVVAFGINSRCNFTTVDEYAAYQSALINAAKATGVSFCVSMGWNAGDTSLYKSDLLHPNTLGSKRIANNMLSHIDGMLQNTTLGATDYWTKSSALSALTAKFTPTAAPNVYNVAFDLTIGSAGGYAWNFPILTLSFIRCIPYDIVVPVYKVTKDNANSTTYEYFGTCFRVSNYISCKFINTIAAGDRFVTGQMVFNMYTNEVSW